MALTLGLRLGNKTINETAKFFINDFPEISVSKMADIANTDNLNTEQFFNKLLTLSIDDVTEDFYSELSSVAQIQSGYDLQERSVYGVPVTESTRGYIEFNKLDLRPHTKIKVSCLYIKFSVTATVVFTVTDGNVVTTQSHDVTPGINKIAINKTFQSASGSVEFNSAYFETGYFDWVYYNQTRCNYYCDSYWMNFNVGYDISCVVDKQSIIDRFETDLLTPLKWKFRINFQWAILNTDRDNPNKQMGVKQAEINIGNWAARVPKAGNTPQDYGPYWQSLLNVVNANSSLMNISKEIKKAGYYVVN